MKRLIRWAALATGLTLTAAGVAVAATEPRATLAAAYTEQQITHDTITFTATTSINAPVSSVGNGRWSVAWLTRWPAAPQSAVVLMDIEVSGGSAARWVLSADASRLRLTGYSPAGKVLFAVDDSLNVRPHLFTGRWVGVEVYATGRWDDFGVVVWLLDGTGDGFGQTIKAMTAGVVTRVAVPASPQLAGMQLRRLTASDDLAPLFLQARRG